jgi:hypothetical protein
MIEQVLIKTELSYLQGLDPNNWQAIQAYLYQAYYQKKESKKEQNGAKLVSISTKSEARLQTERSEALQQANRRSERSKKW